jgi:hypothetical protein
MVTGTQQWNLFTEHPLASEIVEGLTTLPEAWKLTPVGEKCPYRDRWQSETPLTKEQIKNIILNGEEVWSKEKQKFYHRYASGYALRLGDVSGGLIALDVDGASVQQLLNTIAPDDDSVTVCWTSGKMGRYQMLFQIPDQYRERLRGFTRETYTTWNGFHCQEGEQLELRYNNHSSVLPCSYHPETGQYAWLIPPNQTPVASAPDWVIKLALGELKDPASTSSLQQSSGQAATAQPQLKLNRWEKYLEQFEYRPYESIPLINCLSRENRDLVHTGVSEGSRDNTAIKIALDAVGCEQWLDANGQAYDGSADEIVREFCSRCSPPLGEKEINRIYKSAQKGSQGSAIVNRLGDDALKKVVASYFWEKEKSGQPLKRNRQNPDSVFVSRVSPLDSDDLKAQLQALIKEGITGANLKLQINELAQVTGYPPKELWGIYHAQLTESERDRAEDKSQTLNLISIKQASIKLEQVVEPALANPLSQVAKMLGSKDEAMLTSLLPVVASLMATDSKLELARSTGFYALPILFTGLVGESGTAKSPTQKTVLKPLFALQETCDQEFEARLSEWEERPVTEGEKKPPKPQPLELWTSDATSEAIAQIMDAQKGEKQGLLIWKDELSALIKDNNSYRNGKGSDAEKLLSGRDGTGMKVNRAGGKRLSVSQSCYSITGGIQPDTLKEQIDFSDPTGHWARFLFCHLPLTKRTFPEDDLNIDLNEYLQGIYQRIQCQPSQTYYLSSEAKDVYKQWFNHLGELAYQESRQGLRNVYSKMGRDTGVLALLLHALNAAIRREEPDPEISLETIKSAIALAKYYIGQVKLLHAEGDAEEGELSPLLLKILNLSERKGWIKAKDVQASDRSFRKKTASEVRSLFTELEAMGLGVTDGKGSRLIFQGKTNADLADSSCHIADKNVSHQNSHHKKDSTNKKQMADTFKSSSSNLSANVSTSLDAKEETVKDPQLADTDQGYLEELSAPPKQTPQTSMETESELADTDVSHPSSPVSDDNCVSHTDNPREQVPLDEANGNSKPELDYVRYQGEIYRVAYRDGQILHLRQSGFSKILHKVHISQVEVKEWK